MRQSSFSGSKIGLALLVMCVMALACGDSPTSPEHGGPKRTLGPAGVPAPTPRGAPFDGSGLRFSDLAIGIRPEQLELVSDSDELYAGVYRYQVMSAAAPTIEVGNYVISGELEGGYLRRVVYSELDGDMLTLGTVEAYWPEIFEGGTLSASIPLSLAADAASADASTGASTSFDTGTVPFSYDLCSNDLNTLVPEASADFSICNRQLGTGCDETVGGLKICGNLTRAQVSGEASLDGEIEVRVDIDPGKVIPGKPAVYYPCNEYPAACLYTGVCVPGTSVIISRQPFKAAECRRLKEAIPPEIIPPSFGEMSASGSGVGLQYQLTTAMAGTFKLRYGHNILSRLIKKAVKAKIRESTKSDKEAADAWKILKKKVKRYRQRLETVAGFCDLEITPEIGLFLVGSAESDIATFSVEQRFEGGYAFSNSRQGDAYLPRMGNWQVDADTDIDFDKPESWTLQAGIQALIYVSVEHGSRCEWLEFEEFFWHTFLAGIVEDVATKPFPACEGGFTVSIPNDDDELIARNCPVYNYKHSFDVFPDWGFAFTYHGYTYSSEQRSRLDIELGPWVNECKDLPPWEPGSCRVDVADFVGRGNLVVEVEADGEDLDSEYEVVLSRVIPDDMRSPPGHRSEPISEPNDFGMSLSLADESVNFRNHPDILLMDQIPNSAGEPTDNPYYYPICKTRYSRIRDEMVRRHCSLVAGVDHALRLEGVANNCHVEEAVVDPREGLDDRDWYRVIQLATSGEPNKKIPVAEPNRQTFKVICSDADLVLGNLNVTTVTRGEDLDPDGYDVFVSTCENCVTDVGFVEANCNDASQCALTISGLVEGEVEVGLYGATVADNCMKSDLQPVTIVAGDNAEVTFEILCAPAGGGGKGSIDLSATTDGESIDPDGYFVKVDGSNVGALPANGQLEADGLPLGDVIVELTDVAGNCEVSGDNPRTATLAIGTRVPVHFEVSCEYVPRVGQLEVFASTTGRDTPSVLTLEVGSDSGPIDANGSKIVTVEAGSVGVGLVDLPPNCSVAPPNPRTLDVEADQSVETTFDVTCVERDEDAQIAGTVEIIEEVDPGRISFGGITDQELRIEFAGRIEGTGRMKRVYDRRSVSGVIDIHASFDDREGFITAEFEGDIEDGYASFSTEAEGSQELAGYEFDLVFEGPVDGPFTYTGEVATPGRN